MVVGWGVVKKGREFQVRGNTEVVMAQALNILKGKRDQSRWRGKTSLAATEPRDQVDSRPLPEQTSQN